MKKLGRALIRGTTIAVCSLYRLVNRCLGRSPERTITDDARRMLHALGVRPGTRMYARLKRIKQLLGRSTRDELIVGGSEVPSEAAMVLVDGYRGYNILYCRDRYYGWPKSAGGFTERRFQIGIAPGAVRGENLQEARSLVDAKLGPAPAGTTDEADWADAAKADVAARNVHRCEENMEQGVETSDNYPTVLIVSTAIGCNLRCKMCYLQSDHELSYKASQSPPQMSDETFARVLTLLPKARDLIITVEGEILLHRKWVDRWLALTPDYPNLRLSMQTNGMLMTEEAIDKILAYPAVNHVAFSLDGATPEVNDAIRVGSKLETIVEAIRQLLAGRQRLGRAKPSVQTHFVMMKENIHELPAYVRRMAELGVEVISARHLIVYHKEQIPYSLYFDQKRCDEMILQARAVGRECGVQPDLPKTFGESKGLGLADRPKCLDPWRHGQILHDGGVYSCCNNAVLMGNLNDPGGFDAIWNNEKYQRLRRTINQGVPEFTLCKYCNAMLPVNLFEAHVYTKLLFELIRAGELDRYCPRPVELRVQPDETIAE